MRARRLESAAALGACTIASVLVSRRLLRADVVSDDALVHQYWMWHFRDPQLFTDPLTAELRESTRYPDGYEALFRLAAQLTGPITFGEWLGVGADGACRAGWSSSIVREHTSWRPAAWIAAGAVPRARRHPPLPRRLPARVRASRRAADGAARDAPPPPGRGARGRRRRALLPARGAPRGRRAARLRDPLARPAAAARPAARGVRAAGARARRGRRARPAAGRGRRRRACSPRPRRARYPEFGAHGPLHFFVPRRSSTSSRTAAASTCAATGSILAARRARAAARPAGEPCGCCGSRSLALPVVALGALRRSPRRSCSSSTSRTATRIRSSRSSRSWSASRSGRRGSRSGRARGRGCAAFALLAAPFAVAGAALYLFPLGPTRGALLDRGRDRGRPGSPRPPRPCRRSGAARPRSARWSRALTLLGLVLAGSDGWRAARPARPARSRATSRACPRTR